MAPLATSCVTCLDGGCPFCLLGWPAEVACDECHEYTETPSPLFCPRCGGTSSRIRIDTAGATPGRVEVEVCDDGDGCGWERTVLG